MNFTNLQEQVIHKPFVDELIIWNIFYSSTVLNFNMEAQTQSNWCWAATSKSVSFFYSALLNPWTQCKIASAELGQTCCTSPVPGPCNVPWYLDKALTRTKNFVQLISGTMTWEAVKAQIDAGLVVGTRIGWSGGGGHFMAIYGVSKILNTKYFHIDDPIYGKSVLTVNQFSTNYQGSGSWTHSYITKKHFYFMWIKDLVFKPELLKPIPEVRPLIRLQRPDLKADKTAAELELSFAHHAYVVGLKDIDKDIKIPERPSSLRVIELDQKKPVALYDLATTEDDPQVLQVSTDDDYLNRIENGMEKIKSSLREKEIEGEMRVLKFPALNLEALWLRTENKENDRYYLLRHFGQEDNVLNEGSFKELVFRQKAVTEKQDDLMGA
ncbi:papain-like cysteine protease family protein [Chitinophaga ginsengisoli]|uniref:Papain like cysteine protease AvrRpt2 n=1 Tax=Chitinophaga ginsengisoli TaxID=363837 RepID=A0A2P8FCY1_9BACT|nr:papain-like cysteine protease family protein [Chitinophaga ginsengisoli]PSL19567.1 papain like cysteine protease AvrRpt2 [Chitinophaga ginsengisoli]